MRLHVVKGIIENCKIYGDFFGKGDIKDLEDKLNGVKYDMNVINEVLENVPIDEYLGRITKEEFMQCLFS